MLKRPDGVDLAREDHLWHCESKKATASCFYFVQWEQNLLSRRQPAKICRKMDLVSSSLAMNWKTAIRTFLLLLAASGPLPVLAASSSLEIPCIEFSAAITVDCLCSLNQENATRINCDNVVFPGDFPVLPFRYYIQVTFDIFVKDFLDQSQLAGVQSEARWVAVVAGADLHSKRHPSQTCWLQPQLHATPGGETLWRWESSFVCWSWAFLRMNYESDSGWLSLWWQLFAIFIDVSMFQHCL